MSNDVLLTIDNRIATITFNRPEYSNAFSKDSYRQVKEHIESCYDNSDVGAVIITGQGKHFSAGGDIKRFKMLIDTKEYLKEENIKMAGDMAAAIRRCPKPTIAMINGAASGAGCGAALACDFRVVTAKSKFIMSFIKMGLPGDTGGIYNLAKLLGTAKATELMMLGTPVGGEEAYRLGLATILAQPENLMDETMAFAEKLAKMPLQAICCQKAVLNEFFYEDIDKNTEKEMKYMVACSYTADFKEAVYAFIEKREPVFQGK